jgi:hypothetical protein
LLLLWFLTQPLALSTPCFLHLLHLLLHLLLCLQCVCEVLL